MQSHDHRIFTSGREAALTLWGGTRMTGNDGLSATTGKVIGSHAALTGQAAALRDPWMSWHDVACRLNVFASCRTFQIASACEVPRGYG